MYCAYCGSKHGKRDSFCQNCGANLKDNSKAVEKNETEKFSPDNCNTKVESAQYSNGCAIAGFILGLISFFSLGSLFIFGIVLSALGMRDANKHNGSGKGLAIAGLILSIFSIVFVIIFLLLLFGIVASLNFFEFAAVLI